MSDAKFNKLLDYETLKQQFGDDEDKAQTSSSTSALVFNPEERLFVQMFGFSVSSIPPIAKFN